MTTLTAEAIAGEPLTARALGTAVAGFNPADLIGVSGAILDPSRRALLFQDIKGTMPVKALGQPVRLAVDPGQGTTGIGTAWKGLSGDFDYYIDATSGSDSNSGLTEGAAWATLNKIQNIPLATGETKRVRVKTGTYDTLTDGFATIYNDITDAKLEIAFEPDCIMDGTVHGANAYNPIYVGPSGTGVYTVEIFGNGLTIQNYNGTTGGTPNGLGYGASATLIAHDVTIDNCTDGISGHDSAVGYFYDCTVLDQGKSLIAQVQSSVGYFYRCRIEGAKGSGPWLQTRFGRNEFYDCVFLPDAAGELEVENALFKRCQIGALDASTSVTVALSGANFVSVVFEDSFVNLDMRLKQAYEFRRCFGLFSGEIADNDGSLGGSFTMKNCVFAGPATGASQNFYSSGDDGGSTTLSVSNNIFAGAGTFMAVDATNAGYIVAAGSTFHNNVLTDSKVYDADLVSADTGGTVIEGTITSDPNIGAANTLLMAGYAFALPSSASEAGADGGNVGFAASAVTERVAQQVRGPDAFPGNHWVFNGTPPVYGRTPASGLRNLLTATEDFTNAVWVESGTAAIDADGNITGLTTTFGDRVEQSILSGESVDGLTFSGRVDVRGSGDNVGKDVQVQLARVSGGSSVSATALVTLTADWQTVFVENVTGVTDNLGFRLFIRGPVAGNATGCQIRLPSVEPGATANAPQRVASEYDVTEDGSRALYGIKFNGTDGELATPSIDLSVVDNAVLAAAFMNTSGATGRLISHSDASPGRLELTSASNERVQGASGGVTARFATSAGGSVPDNIPAYAVSVSDISTDLLEVEGTATTDSTADQGAGNYTNNPVRVGNNSLGTGPFGGWIYYAFFGGISVTADEREDLNAKLAGMI
jgi:hypothetical protein